jgi:Ca2+/H+ antiporter
MAVAIRAPRPYLIPVRVLLMALLFTLMSFAIMVLLGIIGLALWGAIRHEHPNMTLAYRMVAAPVAAVVAVVAIVVTSRTEIRQYRQAKALAEIERLS